MPIEKTSIKSDGFLEKRSKRDKKVVKKVKKV